MKKNQRHLSKERSLLSRMPERVDLPRHEGARASAERVVKKRQPERHLIDNGVVVRRGLVIHTPTAEYELQSPCSFQLTLAKYKIGGTVWVSKTEHTHKKTRSVRKNVYKREKLISFLLSLTVVNQHFNLFFHCVRLFQPPAMEESDFDINETALLIGQEAVNHRVQDVLYTCLLHTVVCFHCRNWKPHCVERESTTNRSHEFNLDYTQTTITRIK